ncbi:MAG: hypothetical protein DRQ56_04470 [Gammaproteobacteria bacterium]|nr:MAG: hypothetical protein DRQ56_04470 [Gammaproteobacteria bacterium]
MTDFYLTLPSNTAPENKTGNFSVYLPRKLQLSGKWEVALVEIQYPYSWNNISNIQDEEIPWIDKVLHERYHTDAYTWIDVTFKNDFMAKIFIPSGHYGNIRELMAAIEYGKEQASLGILHALKTVQLPEHYQLLPEHKDQIKFGFYFSFNQTIKRVICKFTDNTVKHIGLSTKLQYMLGFDQRDFYDERTVAKYHPDIRIGFYSMFVYCSLVEPQIVGNITAPLLRSVHIEGNYGDIIEKLYHSPHYVPVVAKEIDRIEIDIKDDNNQSVPFQFGKTVVKLHFRKRRSLL